jgi:hypothetical protein
MQTIKENFIEQIESILLEKNISHYNNLYNIYINNYSSKILEIGVHSSKYIFVMYSLNENTDEDTNINSFDVQFSFDKNFLLNINLLDLQYIKNKLCTYSNHH